MDVEKSHQKLFVVRDALSRANCGESTGKHLPLSEVGWTVNSPEKERRNGISDVLAHGSRTEESSAPSAAEHTQIERCYLPLPPAAYIILVCGPENLISG